MHVATTDYVVMQWTSYPCQANDALRYSRKLGRRTPDPFGALKIRSLSLQH